MFLPISGIIRRFVLSRKTYDDVNSYSLLIYQFGCDFLYLIYFPGRAVCIFSITRAVDFSIFLKTSSIIYLCLTLILFITGAYHYEYQWVCAHRVCFCYKSCVASIPDSKVHGANMLTPWTLLPGMFYLNYHFNSVNVFLNCRFIVTDFGSMPPDFVLLLATLCMEACIINFGKMWRITVTS